MPQDIEPEEGDVVESRELGAIQIGRRVGKGGMGRVYEACRPNLPDATFAVKFLSPALLEDEEALRRFSGEARRLSELRHRSIVRVQGYGLTKYGPCIVMELLEGQSVSTYLKRLGDRVLDREIACRVITEVLEGLHHVHERGLVHRDIKGDNIILITGHGDFGVKLVDFGIVKETAGERRTLGGVLVGTPSASAPEQLNGGAIGFWTDIYQVGVLSYRMLGGRHPFHEATRSGIQAIMHAHLFEDAPSLAQLAPDVPADVVGAIAAMLRKDPAQRVLPGRDGRPDGSARAFKAPFRAFARELEAQAPVMNTTTHDQRLVQMVLAPSDPMALHPAGPHAAPAPPPAASPVPPVASPGPHGPGGGSTLVDNAPPAMAPPPLAMPPPPAPVPAAPAASLGVSRAATLVDNAPGALPPPPTTMHMAPVPSESTGRAGSTLAIEGPAAAFQAAPSAPRQPPFMATMRLPSSPSEAVDAAVPPPAMHHSYGSTTSPSVQAALGATARPRSAAPLLLVAATVLLLAGIGGAGVWFVHGRAAARAKSAPSPTASELLALPGAAATPTTGASAPAQEVTASPSAPPAAPSAAASIATPSPSASEAQTMPPSPSPSAAPPAHAPAARVRPKPAAHPHAAASAHAVPWGLGVFNN